MAAFSPLSFRWMPPPIGLIWLALGAKGFPGMEGIMNRRHAYWLILGGLVIAWPTVGQAADKNPLNITKGVLDEIHLRVQTLAAGVPVFIRPFSTEGVDLGTGGEIADKEKRFEDCRTMVRIAPDLLVEAFKAGPAEGGGFNAA